MSKDVSKNYRVLNIYMRLFDGATVTKAGLAKEFGVDERSIQRDIDDIRHYLEDRRSDQGETGLEIVYDRCSKCFRMQGVDNATMMDNGQVLAVSKILLESRAFPKKEIDDILTKMIIGCVSKKNKNSIEQFIANEKFNYVELGNYGNELARDKGPVKDRIWALSNFLQKQSILNINYQRSADGRQVKHTIVPVGILFSEYYFYLAAYNLEKQADAYVQKYSYPTIFRIDRIVDYKDTKAVFRIEYDERFKEGEFKKRIQFMFNGELQYLDFKYYGRSLEAVKDRLPTAEVVESGEGYTRLQAEVYGEGVLMWFLSQGSDIEVLKPLALREKLKARLEAALKRYQ